MEPDPPVPAPPPPTVITVPSPLLVGLARDVTLTVASTAISVSWNLVNGAQGYRVEWESDPEPVPETSAGELQRDGLESDIRYRYAVRIGSLETNFLLVPRAPGTDAPSSVSIRPGLLENHLSWTPVPNAISYRVYWSYLPTRTPQDGNPVDVQVVEGVTPQYLHEDLTPGIPYYYVIAAILPGGVLSGVSPEVVATPGLLNTVTATVREGHIAIQWPVADAAVVTETLTQILLAPQVPTLPISIGDLENGRGYALRIRPVFPKGLGPASPTVYGTPQAPVAGTPEHVILSASRGINRLFWGAVAGATEYDVSWFAVDVNGDTDAGTRTVSETTFRHSGLRTCLTLDGPCPTYTYVVSATNTSLIGPEVAAQSLDIQPVVPLVTNQDVLLLAGLKPSGSRVEINGATAVPFDYETAWTALVPLSGVVDAVFPFSMVAVDGEGRLSPPVTYYIARDTISPEPPWGVTLVTCASPTASPRQLILEGFKDPNSAVFRALEPQFADTQIVGATSASEWSGALDLYDQPTTIDLIAKDAAGNVSGPPIAISLGDCPSTP